jgi:hypothetical protein
MEGKSLGDFDRYLNNLDQLLKNRRYCKVLAAFLEFFYLTFVIADSMDSIDENFQEEPPGGNFIGIFCRGMYK